MGLVATPSPLYGTLLYGTLLLEERQGRWQFVSLKHTPTWLPQNAKLRMAPETV